MGCIYNGVYSSLVALFLWQQVTNPAAVMEHCGISPSRYGSFSKLDLFSNSLSPSSLSFSTSVISKPSYSVTAADLLIAQPVCFHTFIWGKLEVLMSVNPKLCHHFPPSCVDSEVGPHLVN